MNINNIKGMFGDAVSNEVRTLELRVGQVVRGVVLQQFPNNEATVSINGVQVRAKLEIPLMEGQASLLQVQPDSKNGQIHLKQVDPAALGMQDPMKDILKALNLPDKSWAQDIIKDLRREGFALNKETAAAFQRAAQLQLPGVSQEQWMNAAAAAFKRGLPMTEATISAMHQLQSGTPIHSLISQLHGQLAQMLQQGGNGQSQQLLTQLMAQLEQGAELLRLLSGTTTGSNSSMQQQAQANSLPQAAPGAATANPLAQAAATLASQAANAGSSQPNQTVQATVPAPLQQGGAHQPAAGAASSAAASQAATAQGSQGAASSSLLPQLMKWLGVSHEALFAKHMLSGSPAAGTSATQSNGSTALQQSAQPLPSDAAAQAQANSAAAARSAAQGGQPQPAMPAANQAAQQSVLPQSQATTANIGGGTAAQSIASNIQATPQQAAFAQQLADGAAQTGTTTNSSPTTAAAPAQGQAQPAQGQAQGQAQPAQGQAGPSLPAAVATATSQPALSAVADGSHTQLQSHAASQQHSVQESLKASIIQLLQAADVAGQVKETAQQLLHAITGQQLMLSPERNHSVFSHVTLFIPIHDGEKGQTASVHVQTRRNRKGELDSDNCRIVFDLQMKTLGPTLVDMNIVNKIVSLNLWNDHPAIAPILDTLKPEVQEALNSHGYMLSSVRASAIPLKEEESAKLEEGKAVIIPPDIEQLNSTRYKGVDFKI